MIDNNIYKTINSKYKLSNMQYINVNYKKEIKYDNKI
jgi:hypothetical protein